MAFILGKKLGMTRVFIENGTAVPVTVLSAGPITVTRIKTKETDGYEAVQVGFGSKKKDTKPRVGQFAPANIIPRYVQEVAPRYLSGEEELKVGNVMTVERFEVGQKVRVQGMSKAKGFQGAVKRHGFAGSPASHGHKKVLRRVGSIGQRFPQHTLRGMRMAGRMGGVSSTVRGLKIMSIDPANNTIAVKGAVPGPRGSLLAIYSQ